MLKNLMPKLLNRKVEKSNWQYIISTLGNLNGKVVGDIGSGGGFLTLKFASFVGNEGKVYAIDNNQENLDFIDKFTKETDQDNIELILSKGQNIPLKQNSVDIFFSRNSFHHIQEPESYFSGLLPLLKANGRVAIIDYRKTKKINFINMSGHFSDEQKILSAMKKAGYQHLESYNISEDQSYNIFQKNNLA